MNYKDTVFLPRTDFPMRGGLPTKEPQILQNWQDIDIYKKLREARKDAPRFTLHDGPPYANGQLHIGHALNKILKDVVNRSQSMLGKNANYVPGWDCHGLPIEWKIEEQYRKKGKDKDVVPVAEFRQECRDFAAHWLGVQSEEFQRLGVLGDWQNPYTTMAYAAEAKIAEELGRILMDGSLYRGAKPVMWSPVEKTALAEAEIEYEDHTSTTIYARFPVTQAAHAALEGASVIIWTTTPWTMPANRAVAYGDDISYQVTEVLAANDGALCSKGDFVVIADDLADSVISAIGVSETKIRAHMMGREMAGSVAAHPMAGHGYDFDVPLLAGSHVTTEQGTGFVHIAPGHGVEDYELAHLKHGIAVPDTVGEDGVILPHLPVFGGMHVLRDNAKIAEIMAEHKGVIGIGKLVHSYPHSWRSKAPLIYRNTAQWFVSMESHGLRDIALGELAKTKFYPAAGQKRLTSMIAQRPDWCLSRQRAWGVPLTIFAHKQTGEPLRDPAVHARIVEAMKAEGADCWFMSEASRFLGDDYNPDDYEKITDILDVWFDSGSTHSFVLEDRDDLESPADLYLEGSDQHRGWFHSSLLQSCATRARAPYKAVLTHGFVLDEQGRKMSKSLGNVVTPQKVMEQNGADILRLWVVSSDYYNDLRIGAEIIKRTTDNYRRFRNTLRYLLGALDGFDAGEKLGYADMPELEKWVLHRLASIDAAIREMTETYDFHGIFSELHQFCNSDLSAFYFEIRKDTLYCDNPDATARRACRTVMDEVFNRLTAWLAPILCFTAEEAWQSRHADLNQSVHLRSYDPVPADWHNDAVAAKWAQIRKARQVVMSALETARNDGKIGASLQATPMVYISADMQAAFAGQDAASLFITSSATLSSDAAPDGAFRLDAIDDVAVVVAVADGEKCARCWKITPEVSADVYICSRCQDVVSAQS
ncbi:isoleucine--tRNA ligase [Candidatus Ponderosibacter sp. Uisw_141_02]|uniref:isoleucine--tRNA ligase n=1 Tax=Candidatus Ponderosibacter sp. Uisw_141_02 TaxID=3231000 RepID=UPI003D41A2E3